MFASKNHHEQKNLPVQTSTVCTSITNGLTSHYKQNKVKSSLDFYIVVAFLVNSVCIKTMQGKNPLCLTS